MQSPANIFRQLIPVISFYCFLNCLSMMLNVVEGAGDVWPLDRPDGMATIQSLEVMCGKDHMDVHLSFSHPFEGIVSSKGQHGDPRCVYVPPSTGQTFFSFRISYTRCGTKPDLHGQFYENTVVVQYDKDLLEVWDEAKRLRCEWFNDYEKTASKPPMVIADLDVIQLDFRGDNVDCWMEIQHGKGPWAPPVSGIVPLGSTLTLVVAINDYRSEFDMRVKSCAASDGGKHLIQLSDELGCVLRPKMISRFLKARGADERASVITYAFFHAFKFPDALSVHIKCKVEICRHGCLDHCQQQHERSDIDTEEYSSPIDRKDVNNHVTENTAALKDPINLEEKDDVNYDNIVQEGDEGAEIGIHLPQDKLPLKMGLSSNNKPLANNAYQVIENQNSEAEDSLDYPEKQPLIQHEKFPYGPRQFKDKDMPPQPAPRSMSNHESNQKSEPKNLKNYSSDVHKNIKDFIDSEDLLVDTSTPRKRKRSVTVADRRVRSADVGVSGLYDVISEADLAFSPDIRSEAVTVFQGQIREEIVYGICMPVPGFSILFVLVAVSAVIAALVAGSLLYRYQLQKEQIAECARQNGAIPLSTFSNWMSLRLLRSKPKASTSTELNGSISEDVVSNLAMCNKINNEQLSN